LYKKVLGTFITEWEEGTEVCKSLLATKESAQKYAERLAELAMVLGFDGWLVSSVIHVSKFYK
jgi:mannosyl-glycoprotein endo-beta-N-acetylglucosaminidase